MKALVDNDILFKGACYGLLDAFLAPVSVAGDSFGILGAARFVVSKKIIKKAPHKGIAAAHEHLATFLGRAAVVEPTEDEQRMAAEFELAAQRAGLGFDAGESQLCSILICRSTGRLFWRLARVNVSGWRFEGDCLHRRPKLTDQQEPILPGGGYNDHKVRRLDDIVGLAPARRWRGQNLEPGRSEDRLPVRRELIHNTGFSRRTGRGSVGQTIPLLVATRECLYRGKEHPPHTL